MKEETSNELWKAILRQAIELRLATDQAIADHCGVSLSTIRRIKRGGANLTRSVINQIEDRMGLSKPSLSEALPVDIAKPSWIEIKGRVWATPDRMSIQALKGTFVKGLPEEHGCFGVVVEGDSMFPAYVPGDIAIVRPRECELSPYSDADDANVYVPVEHMMKFHNKDAIVEHNDDTMLKRIQIVKKGGPKYEVQMLSLNPNYPTIKVRFGDVWRMRGIVIRVQKPEIEI